MKRILKRVSLIGMALALVFSLCLSAVGCGRDSGEISVFIFCSDEDKATYQDLIDAWEVAYAQKLREADPDKFGADFTIDVKFESKSDNGDYFDTLNSNLSAGIAHDIFYVSPSNVQQYVANDYVLNLKDYIDFSKYDVGDVWGDALALYAYRDGQRVIESVTYDSSSNTFYETGTQNEVGLYALPKDYSSFSLTYNANFFSETLTKLYKTTMDTHGSVYEYGKTPAAGTLPTSSNATQTYVLQPRTTVTYYPFNFYRYNDLKSAYDAKDPVACMAVMNGGYDVTIPCYPNDVIFDETATDDPATAYDDRYIYPVYTYAEYSALSYAVSYYGTVYDSGRTGTTGEVTADQYPSDNANRWKNMTWLQSSSHYGVYGNDQYDTEPYYLTAWLYGNDATIINPEYTSIMCDESAESTSSWGINSDAFIEAYGAFTAYGSDWNNNMYWSATALEGPLTRQGGFTGFTGGHEVFYGFGTWNISSFDKDKSVLDNQIMATPVSEDHALHSRVKNAKYEPQTYGDTSKSSFTESEITEAMKERQNEWGARMDSVGYGINSNVLNRFKGENEWKISAVADLCAYLTIDADTQVRLTYAGSQMPNYVSQCKDYVSGTGAFEGIVTPESDQWDTAYAAAMALSKVSDRSNLSKNVKTWLTENGYESLVSGENACFNDLYANYTVNDLQKSVSRAFRLFNMSSLNTASRNLLVRMADQNGAKDPCLYTYSNSWWGTTFAKYEGYYLLNFNLNPEEKQNGKSPFENYQANVNTEITDLQDKTKQFVSVYKYCQALASYGQNELQKVLERGEMAIN